jgi:hypothetical protein
MGLLLRNTNSYTRSLLLRSTVDRTVRVYLPLWLPEVLVRDDRRRVHGRS